MWFNYKHIKSKSKLFIGVMGKFKIFLFPGNFPVTFKVNMFLYFNAPFIQVQERVFPINLRDEGKPLLKEFVVQIIVIEGT